MLQTCCFHGGSLLDIRILGSGVVGDALHNICVPDPALKTRQTMSSRLLPTCLELAACADHLAALPV